MTETHAIKTTLISADAPTVVPRHLGIVLDGNRRWARKQGLPTAGHGHRVGFRKIPDVLAWCDELSIGIVTLWMLSDDNIARRSSAELDDLYRIDRDVITELAAVGHWRLHHIGRAELLPISLTTTLRQAENDTRNKTGMLVNLALGYGGRADLLAAIRALVRETQQSGDPTVSAERLAAHLSTAGQPDPDLIIRPSGEIRTSGFLLWQAALAELYFCDHLWPDFTRTDLLHALRTYSNRQRRMGA
ncbi:polyprenyl diphosphate synthase [Streptomyces sp. SM11]|uniref:polyprenyl diphosphate synthase n=1 Tax=Streptomyces sp. SM11 TaxID=565557 RepID=UPI000CD4DFBC|nr:polyprenyl diphosphate synthase [Streptomyces sp. SM11]